MSTHDIDPMTSYYVIALYIGVISTNYQNQPTSTTFKGVPRNFCESIKYYLGVSQEQNCENGYCITTSDYYRCQCNPDYKPDHYGMECIPKSSNQNTAIQRSNHIIDVCKNKVRFRLSSMKIFWENILKPTLQNPCKGAVCVNLNGGIKTYFCECKRGFKRVSHQECEATVSPISVTIVLL